MSGSRTIACAKDPMDLFTKLRTTGPLQSPAAAPETDIAALERILSERPSDPVAAERLELGSTGLYL